MKNSSKDVTGGCQCGAIRYRYVGEPGDAAICHCRMCQKAFGSWGAPLVSLRIAQLGWTRGRPSEFRSSPLVARGFCADCGTPLYMLEDGDASYEMAIGTLDDPERAPPTHQVGIESEVAWFRSMHDLPRRETKSDPQHRARYTSRQHPDHDTAEWTPGLGNDDPRLRHGRT